MTKWKIVVDKGKYYYKQGVHTIERVITGGTFSYQYDGRTFATLKGAKDAAKYAEKKDVPD